MFIKWKAVEVNSYSETKKIPVKYCCIKFECPRVCLVLYARTCVWFGVTLRKDTVSVKKAEFVSREFHHTVMHGFRNNYLFLYRRGFEGYLNYMLALCVNVFSVKSGCRSLLVFLLIMQMSAFFRNANSFLCSLWLVCPNWEEEKVNKVLKNMRR